MFLNCFNLMVLISFNGFNWVFQNFFDGWCGILLVYIVGLKWYIYWIVSDYAYIKT